MISLLYFPALIMVTKQDESLALNTAIESNITFINVNAMGNEVDITVTVGDKIAIKCGSSFYEVFRVYF